MEMLNDFDKECVLLFVIVIIRAFVGRLWLGVCMLLLVMTPRCMEL